MKVVNETRNSWELLIKLEYELGQAALLVLYCNGEQRYTIYSGLHIKKSMLDLLCIPMRQARYQITRIPYHRECFRLAWWFGNARERGSAQLRARITKSPDYQITVTPECYCVYIYIYIYIYIYAIYHRLYIYIYIACGCSVYSEVSTKAWYCPFSEVSTCE